MSEINLLTHPNESVLKKRQVLKILRRVSFIALGLVTVFAIITFFLKFNSPLPSKKEEEAALITQISKYADIIVELNIIKNKLSVVSDIVSKRTDFTRQTNIITNIPFPTDNLEAVSVSQKGLSFNASSPTLGPLDTLLNSLVKLAENKVVKRVVLNSLTAGDKSYFISVSVDL